MRTKKDSGGTTEEPGRELLEVAGGIPHAAVTWIALS